jgi:hypothetical protein
MAILDGRASGSRRGGGVSSIQRGKIFVVSTLADAILKNRHLSIRHPEFYISKVIHRSD